MGSHLCKSKFAENEKDHGIAVSGDEQIISKQYDGTVKFEVPTCKEAIPV
jgi:hypothetical protein